MDTEWERRKEFIDISSNLAQKMLENCSLKGDIVEQKAFTGGLANSNYLLKMRNGDQLVLRLCMQGGKDSCEKQCRILTLLQAEKLVPDIIAYSLSEFPYPYIIMEYCPGRALGWYLDRKNYADKLIDSYFELGKFIMSLQKYKFSGVGPLNHRLEVEINDKRKYANPYVNFILKCLSTQIAAKRLSDELCSKLCAVVKENGDLFQWNEKLNTLVHGDFKPQNIQIRACGSTCFVSSILDWEYAQSGHFYSDIATLFRVIHKYQKEYEKSFIDGFKSQGGYIAHDWKKRAKLYDLINLCDLIAEEKNRPKVTNNVKKLIVETLKLLLRLKGD